MSKDFYLTVGQLKEVIKNMGDDVPVYYQRIEDVYFEKNGWKHDLVVPDKSIPDYQSEDNYIRAFTAFKVRQGNKSHLCITAHY